MYYDRSLDCTTITELNTITEQQSKYTERTSEAITQILDYADTYTNAIVRYKLSGVMLYVHSDAYYLSEPKFRSRVDGH